MGWDPVPTSAHGMGGGDPDHPRGLCPAGQPAAEPTCSTQPLSHTWTDFLASVVTGKVGRAVGWRPVEQQVAIDGRVTLPPTATLDSEPLSLPCTCYARPHPHPVNTGAAP